MKKSDSDLVYKILEIHLFRGKRPVYQIDDGFGWKGESELTLYVKPKDITDRIKTFEDACEWCTENGHHNIRREYDCIVTDTLILDEVSPDLLAYLKLRIITCALNEGWEPTFEKGEERWFPCFNQETGRITAECSEHYIDSSARLMYKTQELAEYAATQFKDIYMDFCYKGKE